MIKIKIAKICLTLVIIVSSASGAEAEEASLPSSSSSMISKGDILRVGGKVNLNANETATSLTAIGADTVIEGQILGNVLVIYGKVRLNSTAKVHGNAIVLLGALTRSSSVRVEGYTKVLSTLGLIDQLLNLASGFPRQFWSDGFWWTWKVFSFLAVFFIQLIVIEIFPKQVGNVSVSLNEKILGAGIIGVVSWLFAFPVSLALFLSVVGIPILPVFLAFLIIATFFGRVGVFWRLGSILLGNAALSKSKGLCLSIGYLSYQIVRSLPYLGKFIFVVVSAIALGICLRTQFGRKALVCRNRVKKRAGAFNQ